MIDAATQRLCHRFWSNPILSGNLATFEQVVSSKPFACALKAAFREERCNEAVQCIRVSTVPHRFQFLCQFRNKQNLWLAKL